MPRPPRCRQICGVPQVDTFCPNGCENTEPILLTLDEYEVIRLVDLEQQTHEQCAAQMDISRSTVQEIYESACRCCQRDWKSCVEFIRDCDGNSDDL